MKMRRLRLFGLAVAAGTILLLSIMAFRSYLPCAGGNLSPKEPPKVTLAMRDAYFVGLGSRGKLWSLKAKLVEIGQDRSVTTLSGVSDGKIFDSDKVMLKVRAGRVVYDGRRQSLRLSKGVMIEGNSGQSVTANDADWNSYSSTLRSYGQVHFKTRKSETIAKQLTVDLKRKELTMNDVYGTVNLSAAESAR